MPRNQDIIQALFKDVLETPQLDLAAVAKYLAPTYVQHVDGVTLDYDGFIVHMQKQKQVIASLSVEWLNLVENGDYVFTSHIVNAQKHDGSSVRVKVLAHFTMQNGQVQSCDELTMLLSGSTADRDIGSRH